MKAALTGAASVLCVLCAAAAHAAAPPQVDTARISTLVRKLDSDRFAVRQKADLALRACGKGVIPQLHTELEKTTSLEVRWRLRKMIHDLTIDERLGELINQLGNKEAQARAIADWELRKCGEGVVPLLRKELKPGLDPVRRQHLEKIIAELSAPRKR
jgi:hypothetical protein